MPTNDFLGYYFVVTIQPLGWWADDHWEPNIDKATRYESQDALVESLTLRGYHNFSRKIVTLPL